MKTRKTKRHKLYSKRKTILNNLGFASYVEYLKSNTWHRIRKVIFDDRGGKCKICEKTATEVHHLRYSRNVLLGEKFYKSGLMLLCRKCHQWISELAMKKEWGEEYTYQVVKDYINNHVKKIIAKGNLNNG